MFEKSRVLWHLSAFETAAGTPAACHEAFIQMATVTGLTERAVQFARDARNTELGAAYFAIALTEMAAETNAPKEIMDALSELMVQAVAAVNRHFKTNPFVAQTLLTTAMGVQAEVLSANKPETVSDDDQGPQSASDPPFQITGNMPDVTQCQPTRAFRAGQYLVLFAKDVPPVAEQLGPNPMALKFTYVIVAIDSRSRGPKFFVTLERSIAGANMLCTLDGKGAHSNLGVRNDLSNDGAFVAEALSLVKRELGIKRFDEVKR